MIEYDDTIRAKGVAYSILGSFYDHSVGRGRVTLADGSVRVYLFEKAGLGMAAVFNTSATNKVLDLTATLTAGDLKTFEMMGNLLPASARVPCTETPVYVVGQNLTVDRLRLAFTNAVVSVQPDTQAPNLTMTVGPRGTVQLGEVIQFRWLAIDNQDVPKDEDPLGTLYSFKLEGLDADWSPWGQVTWIEYDRLGSGEYSFQVMAGDKSGNVSDIASRTFTVSSPVAKPTGLRRVGN